MQAVGAGEIVHGGQARQVLALLVVAARAEQVHVPLELGTRLAALFLPADDVAIGVAHARVGGVQRGGRALRVVGHGHVHLVVQRVHATPLGTVHLGRAAGVGRQAAVHEHVGLVGERVQRVGGVDAVLAERQLQPLAAAIVVELGGVQGALVQVLGTGGHAAVDVLGVPLGIGHELEHVLVARIVAR